MNRQIKKMGILLGCFCMAFSITGCGKSTGNNEVEQQEVTQQDENIAKEETQQGEGVSFSGKDIEGNEVNATDLFKNHKITMVNVWATYCQPCIQELPDLEELSKELESEEIQIIGIVSDVVDRNGDYYQENWELGKRILEEKGVTYPNVMCDISSFQNQIMIDAVPTTFFVDENGKVVGQIQIGSVSKEIYSALAKEALQEILE